MKRTTNLAVAFTLLLSATLTHAAPLPPHAKPPTRPATPAEGDKAPEVELKTVDRQLVRLSDELKERRVVLVVLRGWPGYQCPICTRQVADLRAHADQIEKENATVILVYPGPATKLNDHANDFIAGKGLPASWRFVIDPDYYFLREWGLRWQKKGETSYPSTFVIDRDGTVRFAKVSMSHGDRADAKTILQQLRRKAD